MKTKVGIALAFLLLLVGSFLVFFPKEKVVVEVGTTKITDREVRLSKEALKHLKSQTPDETTVLERMIKGHFIVELLKLKGSIGFEEALLEEAARFEVNPELQKQFYLAKKSIGNDDEKLKKLVLIPLAADRLAFSEGYWKDEAFNREKADKAEAFLKKVQKNPENFTKLAREERLELTPGKWIKGYGVHIVDPKFGSFVSGESANLIREAERQGITSLEKLAAGQVLDHVVDNRVGFWIIKSHGPLKSKDGIKIEAALVRREPFGLWLQKNAKLVTVKRMVASEKK